MLNLEFCNPVWFANMEFRDSRFDRFAFTKDNLIDDLKHEVNSLNQKIKQYKYREEASESDMEVYTLETEKVKRELDIARKELKETRCTREEMEKIENEEIEEFRNETKGCV